MVPTYRTIFLCAIAITALLLLFKSSSIGARTLTTNFHLTNSQHQQHLATNERLSTLPSYLANADQTDPRLAYHILKKWLEAPHSEHRDLRNESRLHYSQSGQSEYIDSLLHGKRDGFFVECGAGDGEQFSNSLFFEKTRNWTGLMIEANPTHFNKILTTGRQAYAINACLSPTRHPEQLEFQLAGVLGGLSGYVDESRIKARRGGFESVTLQCFPLLAILRAMDISHVDYFSLDVEGAEYEILDNFPFDLISIDTLSVEYARGTDRQASVQRLNAITDLMTGKFGYRRTSYSGPSDIVLTKVT